MLVEYITPEEDILTCRNAIKLLCDMLMEGNAYVTN